MKIACGQMTATTINQAATVWPVVERLAARAADTRADLLVLPEATYPAYWLESTQRYFASDVERTPQVIARYARLAAQHRLWLVVGIVEEADAPLYNSAAVFDRDGRLVCLARKHFLWDCDHNWFSPGRALTVFDTSFGPMGIIVCADARLPEITATLANLGATFILQPTAWVNGATRPGDRINIQPEFLIAARAREFGVPFACCSKAGSEDGGLSYVGQSRIVAADGALLATAPLDGEALVVADVEPRPPTRRPLPDALRDHILNAAPPDPMPTDARPCRLPLRAGLDATTAALRGGAVRVAELTPAELDGFGPARAAALSGAECLIVRGDGASAVMARARAAENRVFVLTAGDAPRELIHPNGAVIWRATDDADVEIDPAEADDKRFTPQTPIWSQRIPACYRL